MSTTETRWFKAVTLILSLFFIIYTAINIAYYNRIRSNPSQCSVISRGQATGMIWLNVIILIISIILLFWSIITLIFTRQSRQQVVSYLQSPSTGFVNIPQQLIPSQQITTTPTPNVVITTANPVRTVSNAVVTTPV